MLPLVLARQIEQGIKDYLLTTFPPSHRWFAGFMDDLLKEGGFFKGPYLSVKLPFKKGTHKDGHFSSFTMPFHPHLHQERAFKRLGGNIPKSTIIATGTGSGKTECFMFPILDYIYSIRGRPGIKAIIIYPMNALAHDQARRFARIIGNTKNFAGNITAGLFIGRDTGKSVPELKTMGSEMIITHRQTMLDAPPDILLTNYKMLDLILLRPRYRKLFEKNGIDTLKYLIVDELHTFDGAQGTDLACLIRRLKARLKSEEGSLCCIGTSATLGSGDDASKIAEYSERIFGESFDKESVITEEKISADEFFYGTDPSFHDVFPEKEMSRTDPYNYATKDQYISAQAQLWYGDDNPEPSSGDWCSKLGEKIKQTDFFIRLMEVLESGPVLLSLAAEILSRTYLPLKGKSQEYCKAVIMSMLSLVSAARAKDNTRMPFLQVGIQYWIRELRRMVGKVGRNPKLLFADDLSPDEPGKRLPLLHCRECGAMCWGATRSSTDPNSGIVDDLLTFYSSFFSTSHNVTFLFPARDEYDEYGDLTTPKKICTTCLATLADFQKSCQYCGESDPENIIIIEEYQHKKKSKTSQKFKGSHNCPYCRAFQGLTIIGARSATLSAVALHQLYSSPFNSEKKLIAFSDSVQDASHRAGFFGARTYQFNLRIAVQRILLKEKDISLVDLPEKVTEYYKSRFGREQYFSVFCAPGLEGLPEFSDVLTGKKKSLPDDLLYYVGVRLKWDIYRDFGSRTRIGRTLENTGSSVCYVDTETVDRTIADFRETLMNQVGGFKKLTMSDAGRFIRGFLYHVRIRGGIAHEDTERYIKDDGRDWLLGRDKDIHRLLPRRRAWGNLPVFPCNKGIKSFDALLGKQPERIWYGKWAIRCFKSCNPAVLDYMKELYEICTATLVKHGIFIEFVTNKGNKVWGIDQSILKVTSITSLMKCNDPGCNYRITVATAEKEKWFELPCPRIGCNGFIRNTEEEVNYYRKLYETGDVQRIIPREHTGLLGRKEREELEDHFIRREKPWWPNLLSATPTLEMGIDIGDLSAVLLCSVPPDQSGYLQRSGRAGREKGNALHVTFAAGKNHDLFFYEDPLLMITGQAVPPGLFMDAPAVLERQLLAFSFDSWIISSTPPPEIPRTLGPVFRIIEGEDLSRFPYTFINYIETNAVEIVKTFTALFGSWIHENTKEFLFNYMTDKNGDRIHLAEKLFCCLRNICRERNSINNRQKDLRSEIARLEKRKVLDEKTEIELREIKREANALSRIVKQIDIKQVFEFLTDEGLLPNYTFPESGVILRSLIIRESATESDDSKPMPYEYQRPAHTALTEFAPKNVFYAGGRKVEIDQVDLSTAAIEKWRFCSECDYCINEELSPNAAECPRCGSPLWRDNERVKYMVRMRQVYATSKDSASRIYDEKEEREPAFFVKHLFVDFEPDQLENAWCIDDDELPFGFEYINRILLREINFGNQDPYAKELRIGGLSLQAKGFHLCQSCGKVQKKKKKNEEQQPSHTTSCPSKNKGKDALIDGILLYRELQSEAVRILLPVRTITDEESHQSFIAALFLGLKMYFGGKIDHIASTIQHIKVKGSPLGQTYLILYDCIPGGTGYLKQLLSDKNAMIKVFENAAKKITACSCKKDGCYRCVFAYRTSRYMKSISKKRALSMLAAILSRKEKIIKADNLQDITSNKYFESELEKYFIETLRQSESPSGNKFLLEKRSIRGKECYMLQVDDFHYEIEPQVSLGRLQNVLIESKADFIIRLVKAQSDIQKPVMIAVYTDGFSYHADPGKGLRIDDDFFKRMAVTRSGEYITWSLSWEDVEESIKQNSTNYHFKATRFVEKTFSGLCSEYDIRQLMPAAKLNAFKALIHFLANPYVEKWTLLAVSAAVSLSEIKWISRQTTDKILGQLDLSAYFSEGNQTEKTQNIATTSARYGGNDNTAMEIVCFIPDAAALRARKIENISVLTCLYDKRALDNKIEKAEFQRFWNTFINLYNIFQFLPDTRFVTSCGIEKHLYAGFFEMPIVNELDEILSLIPDPRVKKLVENIHSHGIPLPEAGIEITDSHGKVIGEAELAWPDKKVCLLLENMKEQISVFKKQEWKVFVLDEASIEELLRSIQ